MKKNIPKTYLRRGTKQNNTRNWERPQTLVETILQSGARRISDGNKSEPSKGGGECKPKM